MSKQWIPKAGAPLTEHESRILTLISEGKTNARIGRELFVTEDTVKTQVRNIFYKLGIRDRAGAVRVGIERGAIAVDHRRLLARELELVVEALTHRAQVAAVAGGPDCDRLCGTTAVVRTWHDAAKLVRRRAAELRGGVS